jgi:hypothetical protein
LIAKETAMTTITYVATVALFAGQGRASAGDSVAPTARVRFVNGHYTYIGVYNIPHDRLRAVTGYSTDFWEQVDILARRVIWGQILMFTVVPAEASWPGLA